MLRRKALEEFAAWRDEHGNRALLVTGARQVGKTYLVREFLHAEYENVIETSSMALAVVLDGSNIAMIITRPLKMRFVVPLYWTMSH